MSQARRRDTPVARGALGRHGYAVQANWPRVCESMHNLGIRANLAMMD